MGHAGDFEPEPVVAIGIQVGAVAARGPAGELEKGLCILLGRGGKSEEMRTDGAGIGKAVRNFIETHNLTPKGVTLTADDIREGLVGVLSIFIAEPQFQGQTKDRLNNPEILSAVDSASVSTEP